MKRAPVPARRSLLSSGRAPTRCVYFLGLGMIALGLALTRRPADRR